MLAIGEMLIVSIGIIVAIRLENYNQQRQWNQDYEKTMERLYQEIELNIKRIESLDGKHYGNISLDSALTKPRALPLKYAVHYFDSVRVNLEQGIDTADIMYMMKGPNYRWNHFNLHSEIFDEMVATGMLYKIKPDTLLVSIQQYYRYLEREEIYNDNSYIDIIDAIKAIRRGWGILLLDYDNDGMDCLDLHPWIFDMNSDAYKDLRLSYDVIGYSINSSYRRMNNIIVRSQKLLELIEAVRSQ